MQESESEKEIKPGKTLGKSPKIMQPVEAQVESVKTFFSETTRLVVVHKCADLVYMLQNEYYYYIFT